MELGCPEKKGKDLPQEELRAVWDKAWGRTHPVRHDRTAALMLSWHPDDNDDEKVPAEQAKLAEVFREYGFEVYEEHLSTKDSKPQFQARAHLASFAMKEDRKRGLLIVYYAGHASWEEAEQGKIFLCGKWPTAETIDKDAVVDWIDAESNLTGTSSDVLVIFDCCHAGVICKPASRGSRRCFEYLVATNETGRTRVAGEKSFTTALIWALNKLKSKPGFYTTDLVGAIKKAPGLPDGQYPHVYGSRFDPCAEHIYIAPMHPLENGEGSPVGQYRDEKERDLASHEVVDLRFHLPLGNENRVSKRYDAVKKFARQLKGLIEGGHIACSDVQLLDKDFRITEWTAGRLWKAKAMSGRKRKGTALEQVPCEQDPVVESESLLELTSFTPPPSTDEKSSVSGSVEKRPKKSSKRTPEQPSRHSPRVTKT